MELTTPIESLVSRMKAPAHENSQEKRGQNPTTEKTRKAFLVDALDENIQRDTHDSRVGGCPWAAEKVQSVNSQKTDWMGRIAKSTYPPPDVPTSEP
jgi:hypothetical protein